MNKALTLILTTMALTLPALAQPVTTVLKLKDRVSMQELAQNVQNPKSAHYRQFYTPAEIRALAAPSDKDYAALLQTLKNEGFAIVQQSPTHLWISVKADTQVYQSLFSVRFSPTESGSRKVLSAARVPFYLSMIESVNGLDNTHKRHAKNIIAQEVSTAIPGVQQATIKTAYNFDPIYASGLTGQDQHIAIATYDGFHADIVRKFYALSKLSPLPTVDQVAFNGDAKFDENSAVETALDAEFAGMMAPGASVHVFASAENSDAGEMAMFTAILDDNRAKVVNYSWGSCEVGLEPAHVAEMTTVFARAVAQGVNIMVASGDSGSDSCQDGTVAADWPAGAPNVVAVGGTHFSYVGGKIAETGWTGSGGGISAIWDLPDYQNNLGGVYVKRSYPDVSFNADPASGQAVYAESNGRAGWFVIGGTSMAAPQWSGFMALVGEARAKAAKAPVGFINPIIYTMADEDRAANFHDVTAGSNGKYTAGAGWDAVTGLGTMDAGNLLTHLTAQ
jgi:subtilase family serine protease